MNIITRFAPSPTGLLHVGNVRTALVNWLYTKNHGGKFMLRIDDTDLERSEAEYTNKIYEDLTWLGLSWDIFAKQSDRLDHYEEIKLKLLAEGRLYPCFETKEELEIKRRSQISRGVPPIYDRGALKLTDSSKQKYLAEGRKPHYRFLLNNEIINWHDGVRGEVTFEAKHLTDPILIREDGTVTYIFSSVVDDVDFAITDIIRGEDHVSNTAVQIQIFKCLSAVKINFAHLAMIKTKEAGISKRTGGFDIQALREEGFEAMAIINLLANLGTSHSIGIKPSLNELAQEFDISRYGRSPANYDIEELLRINHKIVTHLEWSQVKDRLQLIGIEDGETFWYFVRNNLNKFNEVKIWWDICKAELTPIITDRELLQLASTLLPKEPWDETSWEIWLTAIKAQSSKGGKELFHPLRLALTGTEHGPELKKILPLIGRSRTELRLQGQKA
jgi:glutamyl-tRNA synthetase